MISKPKLKIPIALLTSLTLIAALGGCVSKIQKKPITTTEGLTGSWYGQNLSDSEQLIWVNQRNKDGSFKLIFKKCFNKKELFYQVKTGVWTHKHNTYATTTTELSDHNQTWQPATPNRRYIEKYTIKKLADNILYYGNDKGDFKAYHVDSDYKLQCGEPPVGLQIK